jgi:hypothetical protein
MRVRTRRTLSAALIVVGALLMLFATETTGGLALILTGVAVEIFGIALEHR